MFTKVRLWLSAATAFALVAASLTTMAIQPAGAATTIDASALAFTFNYTPAATLTNKTDFTDGKVVSIAGSTSTTVTKSGKTTTTTTAGFVDGDIIRYNTVATTATGLKIDAVVTTSMNQSTKTITQIVGNGTLATVTTAADHKFVVGQSITISGSSTAYNATFVVNSVIDARNFKIASTSSTTQAGGSVKLSANTLPTGIKTDDAATSTSGKGFYTYFTTGTSGAYTGISFNFAFYEHGTYTAVNTGTPVNLTNVTVYVDDLDSSGSGDLQFAEMSGFQKYVFPKRSATPPANCLTVTSVQNVNRCDSSKINTVPVTGTNLTRFMTTDTANSSSIVDDRATVVYNSMSSVDVRLGVDKVSSTAQYTIAFGVPASYGTYGAKEISSTFNTPPEITGTTPTLNVLSGAQTVLTAANFGTYYDFDANPFYSLAITSLPTSGSLQSLSSGVWRTVTINTPILVSDINLGKLQFTGAYDTSMQYKVNDSLDNSTAEYTLNIGVRNSLQQILFTNPGTKQPVTATFASNATSVRSDGTTSTGLTVSLVSNTTGICTVSGLNITTTGTSGTCSITASQLGDATYAAATAVTQQFVVSSLVSQQISFNNPGDQVWSASKVIASGAVTKSNGVLISGLKVTLASLTPTVCTVNNTPADPTIVLMASQELNTCSIQATQLGGAVSGGSNYAAAVPVVQTFQVIGTSYTLTYDGNGNTGGTVPGSVTSSSGFTASINSGSLVKTGSVFSGWYTNANGTGGTLYLPSAPIPATSSITLYAYWVVPTTYTVTYNYQGGSAPTASTAYIVGTTAPLTLPVSTKSGYTLLGWGTTGTATSYVSNPYIPTGDITLYAIWSANNYGASANTTDPTNVTAKSVQLNGTVVAGSAGLAGSNVSNLKLCYSASNAVDSSGILSSSPTCSSNLWSSSLTNGATGTYNVSAGNLSASTMYFAQTKLTLVNGLVLYGAVKSFTTLAPPLAEVQAPTKVSSKQATIVGAVNPNSNNLTKVAFCVSATDPNVAVCDQDLSYTGNAVQNQTTGLYSFNIPLTNLLPHTTYYYKVYTLSEDGGVTAMRMRLASVTTGPLAPVQLGPSGTANILIKKAALTTTSVAAQTFTTAWADTNTATNVKDVTATINGQLNAGTAAIATGDVSSLKLCYSTTNAVDSAGLLSNAPFCGTNIWGSSSVAANSSQTFARDVSSLTAVTNYYSQIQVVFTDGSTANGGPVLFKTAAPGAVVVTFNSNYTGGPASYTQSSATATNLMANIFTRTGYTFAGWNTNSGGTGTNYADGASFPFTSATTLYAKWTANTYVVTWNATANGGTAMSPGTSSYTYGGTAIPAQTPAARNGYTFTGWYSAQTGGSLVVSPGATFSPASTQTLYARWSLDTLTITWDATTNGGSITGNTTDFTIESNTVTGAVPDPIDGKTFTGWYSSASGGSLVVAADGTFSPTSSRTLYGQWVITPYTVTWDATSNGGTAISPLTNDVTPTNSISAPTPSSRVGYDFLGWFDLATGGNKLVDAGSSYTPVASTTLFAQWSPKTYVVTWNATANGGSAISPGTSSYIVGGLALTLPTPVARTGYTFNGWFNAASSGTKVGDPGATYIPSGTGTLYAQWSANSYTITYDANTGSGAASRTSDTYTTGGATITLPTVGTLNKTSSTFNGWSLSAGLNGAGGTQLTGAFTTSHDVTLYAIWVGVGSHTVTFHAKYPNNTDATAGQTSAGTASPLTANGFSYIGYSFAGWDTSSAASTVVYADTANFNFDAGDANLYAVWTANTYTITWNATTNGGTAISPLTSNYTTGGTAPTAPTPAPRTGYSFLGWYSAASGGSLEVLAGATYGPSTSPTLYGVWQPDTYIVTWDMATNTSGAQSNDTDTYIVGDPFLTANTPAARPGYTFNGWFDAATGGSQVLQAGDPYTPTATKTFFAQWSGETYTVTYDANTGTGAASRATDSFTVGTTSPLTLPTVGTLGKNVAGVQYVFNGWSETPGAQGAGGTKITTAYSPTSDVTLYAIWVAPGSHTVTFHENYGSNGTTTQTSNSSASLASAFTRDGYGFDYWTTNSDGSGTQYLDGASYGFGASIDLYAHWTVFTITFEPGEGAGNISGSYSGVINLPGGSALTPPAGKHFAGWQCPVGTTTLLSGVVVTPTANLVCTAVYTANASFTVLFHSNFGTDPTVTQTANTSGALRLNGFTKSGYQFEYWTTNSDGSGTQYSNGQNYAFTSDLVLYAAWSAVSSGNNGSGGSPVIVLILEKNNGTGAKETLIIPETTPVVNLPVPENPGWVFLGWTLEEKPSAPQFLPNAYQVTKTTSVYAQWKPRTFNVILRPAPNQKPIRLQYTSGGKPLVLPTQKSTGKKQFQGWSLSPASNVVVQSPFVTVKSLSLYPTWSTPTLIEDVFFGGDSPELTPATKQSLSSLARAILAAPVNGKLIISGWVLATKNTSYDLKLSKDRAKNVVSYLQSAGVKAEYKPVARGVAQIKSDKARHADIFVTWSK